MSVRQLHISLDYQTPLAVGRLATRDGIVYFEYDDAFLDLGLEISPFHLAARPGIFQFERGLFDGLAGVFNDSLPDGWGRLLFDRWMRSRGIQPRDIGVLDRLASIGQYGMGALRYEPIHEVDAQNSAIDLDELAGHIADVMRGDAEDVLQELSTMNGSSSGARPKAIIGVDHKRQNIVHGTRQLPNGFSHWLVKFPNGQDGNDAGAIEYIYSLLARDAGLDMTATHLFPAAKGSGYFATARFDRHGEERIHCHSAAGLLHSDFRIPALDYQDLLTLTNMLTRDIREVEKLFRQAVFNVLAHNRDDHAKNFSFLMDKSGNWRVSPAYDLTHSSGPGGEQSTMVMGRGNPNVADLEELGRAAQLTQSFVRSTIERTNNALQKWPAYAKQYGVGRARTQQISELIC